MAVSARTARELVHFLRDGLFGYCELKTARATQDEAAIHVLVNSAGTAQTTEDLDRARAIAAGRPS